MYFSTWKPAADIFYAGNEWLVRVELAGVSAAEIEVSTYQNILTVRGRRRDVAVQQSYVCRTMEISYSRFERSITLPNTIITTSVRWECRDGILNVHFNTEDYQ